MFFPFFPTTAPAPLGSFDPSPCLDEEGFDDEPDDFFGEDDENLRSLEDLFGE